MNLDQLLAMVNTDRDSALLRLTLGQTLLRDNRPGEARVHLRKATQMDPAYTAAWKTLGTACKADGDAEAARAAWTWGLDAAARGGDKQAEKEMRVFLRRLDKKDD